MNTLDKILIAAAFAVILVAVTPAAKAEPGDWATQLTIDRPVQIGSLVLIPGSYIFRMADIWAPNVVLIYSVDQRCYEGIVMGERAYRSDASEDSTFIFKEMGRAPEELQYWYYPDSHVGIRFLYPQS